MPRLMSVMNVPSSSTQSLSSTNCVTSLVAHRPFVQADEQRMRLGDDALAEHRGGDRNLRAFGQGQQLVLQAEAMNLDAGDDHRPLAAVEPALGLGRPPRPAPRDRSPVACAAN